MPSGPGVRLAQSFVRQGATTGADAPAVAWHARPARGRRPPAAFTQERLRRAHDGAGEAPDPAPQGAPQAAPGPRTPPRTPPPRAPAARADTLAAMAAEQIARNLAFINWTLLASLAVGAFWAVALLRLRSDATKGFLSFVALCAAVAGGTYGTPAYPSTMEYEPRYFLVNGAPWAAGPPASPSASTRSTNRRPPSRPSTRKCW